MNPLLTFFKVAIEALRPYFRTLVTIIVVLIGLLGAGIASNLGMSAPNSGATVTR